MRHPLRALLVALLGILLLTTPTGVSAASTVAADDAAGTAAAEDGSGPGTSDAASDGAPAPATTAEDYTRAEARAALRRAARMLRGTADPDAPGDLTMALRDLHLARPALRAADRREATRLLSRSTASAELQAAAGAPRRTCSTNICVHYGSGTSAAWAATTLTTLNYVWAREVPLMGRAPLPDGGVAGVSENPDDRLDVFLEDLGDEGYYGYCTTDDTTGSSQVPAFCALDDDFARSQYGAAPLDSLRATAAHEFFHAIQFAADITEDTWFMEGSATWVEDYVYDAINDNYQYLAQSPIRYPRTALDHDGSNFPYGSFIFFTYSTERRGISMVRRYWDMAVGRRTSLQAIRAVVGAGGWSSFMTTFGSWNTLPRHSYSERLGYPRPAWWQRRTLSNRTRSTGWRQTSIAHLGDAAVLVSPARTLSVRKRLLVEIDGPPRASGTSALLQRRYRSGRVTHTMIRLGANGNGRTLVQFDRRAVSSIAVVVANTNRYGAARVFKVRASLR